MWLAFPIFALLLGAPQATSDSEKSSKAGEKSPSPEEGGSNPEKKAPVFYETTTVTARPVSGASGAVTVVSSDELATSPTPTSRSCSSTASRSTTRRSCRGAP